MVSLSVVVMLFSCCLKVVLWLRAGIPVAGVPEVFKKNRSRGSQKNLKRIFLVIGAIKGRSPVADSLCNRGYFVSVVEIKPILRLETACDNFPYYVHFTER